MDWNSPVTFFIGNLGNTLPDSFILSILQQIGKVTRWKRAKDEKDRTIDFGFADFANAKDALKVLRIAPQITVMEKTWVVRTDERVENDLKSFQSSLLLNPSYNPQNEYREDQKILQIINDQISAASFAKANQRIQGVIVSEFDESREAEHFRYQAEIRKENEEYEVIFKDKLLKQKALEVQKEEERKQFEELKEETQKRKARREFLREWSVPSIQNLNEENMIDFVNKWNEFDKIKKERSEMREKEKQFESQIPHDS